MSYLEVRGLRKFFGAVQALNDASLSVERGVIHGLCGANGAGKSTLIRILAGAFAPDAGEVWMAGRSFREFSPQYATALGIGVVHQELALVPELLVYQNVFLGIEPRRGLVPRVSEMKAHSRAILARMGVDIPVETKVGELGLHQQQIVEIAKALSRGTSVLILDEPTSILNMDEKQALFAVLRQLRRENYCVLFITHFIDELFEVCDALTIMRDGRTVATVSTAEVDRRSVIEAMVGAVAEQQLAPSRSAQAANAFIIMRNGAVDGKFSDVTFALAPGEAVGLAGLVGSGCYEVGEALFGLRRLDHGELRVDGRPTRFRNPREAVRAGIGYVPEDRRGKGLCLNLSSSVNLSLPSLRNFSRRGFVRRNAIRNAFLRIGNMVRVRPLDPTLSAAAFSGGNQQKLVIGKWIEKNCRAYVLLEPTRGVDVGAKAEIWSVIERLRREGAAVVLVSTDFDDIAAVCGRCLIFAAGRIIGELQRPLLTSERISAIAVAAARSDGRPIAFSFH